MLFIEGKKNIPTHRYNLHRRICTRHTISLVTSRRTTQLLPDLAPRPTPWSTRTRTPLSAFLPASAWKTKLESPSSSSGKPDARRMHAGPRTSIGVHTATHSCLYPTFPISLALTDVGSQSPAPLRPAPRTITPPSGPLKSVPALLCGI